MTSSINTEALPRRRNALRQRVLACALLVLITYGATWQVAHAHNSVSPRPVAACEVSGDDESNSPERRAHHGGVCSICQLQRQLFSNLIPAAPRLLPPQQTSVSPTATPAHCYCSMTDAPTRGRAPPSTFLS